MWKLWLNTGFVVGGHIFTLAVIVFLTPRHLIYKLQEGQDPCSNHTEYRTCINQFIVHYEIC